MNAAIDRGTPKPRRRWKRVLLTAAMLLIAALTSAGLVADHLLMPGATFLKRLSMSDADAYRAGEVLSVREARIPFPVRIYEPTTATGGSTAATGGSTAGFDRVIVLIHGLHWGGYDETRLIPFARRLAGMGYAVVTPDIPDLKNYDVNARSVDDIERACLWTLNESGLAKGDGKIGIMGICFSGGLGLSAATRPSLRGRVAFVFAFGSHGDLDRTVAYMVTGRLPDGTIVPPHNYGPVILLRWFADRLVPPEDVEPLRAILLDFLHMKYDDVRAKLETLGPRARELVTMCLDNKTLELGAILEPVACAGRSSDVLSPVRLSPPDCPVFLLHGSVDNVVPPSESIDLGRWSPHSRLLISDLVVHVELDKDKKPTWRQTWDLAAFWTKVLRS